MMINHCNVPRRSSIKLTGGAGSAAATTGSGARSRGSGPQGSFRPSLRTTCPRVSAQAGTGPGTHQWHAPTTAEAAARTSHPVNTVLKIIHNIN